MKVIAINDAPIPEKGYYYGGVYIDRAYYKGNIFEVYDKPIHPKDYLIIYHDKLEITMDVDPSNFISIQEYRDKQLNKIL